MHRRDFLRAGGVTILGPTLAGLLAACGKDSPTSTTAAAVGPGPSSSTVRSSVAPRKVKLGFIALTDCASIVMATVVTGLCQSMGIAWMAARPDRPKERTDEIVERYLTAVGLWEHRDKRPAQILGGMAQRTAVARAFAVSPRLLLLDEPFGALDALTRARLQQQLVELWTHESETRPSSW